MMGKKPWDDVCKTSQRRKAQKGSHGYNQLLWFVGLEKVFNKHMVLCESSQDVHSNLYISVRFPIVDWFFD